MGFVDPSTILSEANDVFWFAEPLPLTPHEVVKLAPALSAASCLAVFRDMDGLLMIWGIIHFPGGWTGDSPMYVQIRVERPAMLSCHMEGRVLMTYVRGRVLLFDEEHEEKLFHLVRVKLPLIFAGYGMDDRAMRFRSSADAVCMKLISQRMLDLEHGGMLLIVPACTTAPNGVEFPRPATHMRSDMLKKRLSRLVQGFEPMTHAAIVSSGHASNFLPEEGEGPTLQRIRFEEALDFVANLSAVDGAVVLNADLTIAGFGAHVSSGPLGMSPDATSIPVVLIDPSDPELKEVRTDDFHFSGTRHTAALRFCRAQNRDAPVLAIVASQDGALSLFIRRPDEVVIFRPFIHGVGFML
jgi:hypothetical protein